jgi:signal transduction histidine kinase
MITDMVQRNRDLKQFSFITSHNLRAPTANIIGFTENLLEETITAIERKESLHGLSMSVSRLDTVIKDINKISCKQSPLQNGTEKVFRRSGGNGFYSS